MSFECAYSPFGRIALVYIYTTLFRSALEARPLVMAAGLEKTITEKWHAKYQLVPPDVHQRNAAKRAIRTSKAHFLSILAGVDPEFPKYM